jgi:TolA-binding protein
MHTRRIEAAVFWVILAIIATVIFLAAMTSQAQAQTPDQPAAAAVKAKAVEPVKIKADDALKLRELQVQALNSQLQLERLQKQSDTFNTQINDGVKDLYKRYNLDPDKYDLDVNNWQFVLKGNTSTTPAQ